MADRMDRPPGGRRHSVDGGHVRLAVISPGYLALVLLILGGIGRRLPSSRAMEATRSAGGAS